MDAKELDQLRADIERDLMPDVCDILTNVRVSNGRGGWTNTWGASQTFIACRLDPMTGREVVMAGAQMPFHGYMLTLPHDTTISTANRVRINAVSYDIRSVDSLKSWAGSVRCMVERVP